MHVLLKKMSLGGCIPNSFVLSSLPCLPAICFVNDFITSSEDYPSGVRPLTANSYDCIDWNRVGLGSLLRCEV